MFRRISVRNRRLIILVGLLLVPLYFVPIWFIILKAPQYRDGLSLSIWLTKITGGGEFDLKNINLLNHYVGMRQIRVEDFPEFIYMRYILATMIAGAISTYIYPRLLMVYLGLFSFVAVAIAGLLDFRYWEHEYGHNLDPTAALSIPGISFEPPMLGCKAMMNFNTCSWPHVGAAFMAGSCAVLAFVIFDEIRKVKTQVSSLPGNLK